MTSHVKGKAISTGLLGKGLLSALYIETEAPAVLELGSFWA